MDGLRAAVFGRDVEADGWPTLSVIMPIRNEAADLERAVASVFAQEYPIPFDVCLAVGPSDDGTERLAVEFADADDRVRVVANPAGVTPTGLNAAIAATGGEVVVRVDGHSALSEGYIRRAVETMIRTGAVNVGGRQVPQPETSFEEAVAAATTSWLGTGGATYRVGGREGPVDTVYLGVFDRTAGDEVGWFADDLIRNQDYELNIRLRAAGGKVWFDPKLWVGYRPRGSWRGLARQYYEYGYGKAEVARRFPTSLRLRQLLPVAVMVTQVVALVYRPRSDTIVLIIMLRFAALWAAAAATVRQVRGAHMVGLVAAVIHDAWAVGAIRGFVQIRTKHAKATTRRPGLFKKRLR